MGTSEAVVLVGLEPAPNSRRPVATTSTALDIPRPLTPLSDGLAYNPWCATITYMDNDICMTYVVMYKYGRRRLHQKYDMEIRHRLQTQTC